MKIPLPVVIAKEGKWFVASCPILDIATQGKTEKEVKENMEDLINDYFKDPDTPKPEINAMMQISLTNIPVNIPKGEEQWISGGKVWKAHNIQED